MKKIYAFMIFAALLITNNAFASQWWVYNYGKGSLTVYASNDKSSPPCNNANCVEKTLDAGWARDLFPYRYLDFYYNGELLCSVDTKYGHNDCGHTTKPGFSKGDNICYGPDPSQGDLPVAVAYPGNKDECGCQKWEHDYLVSQGKDPSIC